MIYATQQDIAERHGEELLLSLTDRDGTGEVDTAAVERACADASAEADSSLAERYSLPLPSVPPVLVRVCVDIAVYRMASTADVATEEQRTRYEDAVALLRRIARGEAGLGIDTTPGPSSSGVTFFGAKRRGWGAV